LSRSGTSFALGFAVFGSFDIRVRRLMAALASRAIAPARMSTAACFPSAVSPKDSVRCMKPAKVTTSSSRSAMSEQSTGPIKFLSSSDPWLCGTPLCPRLLSNTPVSRVSRPHRCTILDESGEPVLIFGLSRYLPGGT